MLTEENAKVVAKKYYPSGTIKTSFEYENLFIFVIHSNAPGEESYDPFFSVNKETGEFRDFSIFHDGDPKVLSKLLKEATANGPPKDRKG